MSAAEPDPAAYTTSEPFQREKRSLFAQTWLLLAASGQFAMPGDFVSHGIGGWPLLAVRGKDGAARAFHNVCRHQSMPVVGAMSGHCEALRCPYHGWTYDLAGQFLDAPARFAPAAPATQPGLNEIEAAEQGGVCLVRLTPRSEPPPRFNELAEHRFAEALTTDIDANWKAVVEALLAAKAGDYFWPLAFVMAQPGLAIVRQVVPRSFSRTRLLHLVFASDAADGNNPAAAFQATATDEKAAAEACQNPRPAGEPIAQSSAVGAFLARVAETCAAAG